MNTQQKSFIQAIIVHCSRVAWVFIGMFGNNYIHTDRFGLPLCAACILTLFASLIWVGDGRLEEEKQR